MWVTVLSFPSAMTTHSVPVFHEPRSLSTNAMEHSQPRICAGNEKSTFVLIVYGDLWSVVTAA